MYEGRPHTQERPDLEQARPQPEDLFFFKKTICHIPVIDLAFSSLSFIYVLFPVLLGSGFARSE